jgi:predicted molibdopterin-dependent oxidoreductase YjgC
MSPYPGGGDSAVPEPLVTLTIDGVPVDVTPSTTIREAAAQLDIHIPTLCFGPTITPASACRLCVVELDRPGPLVPACSRVSELGMQVQTASPRVRHARKLVLELLGAEAELERAEPVVHQAVAEAGADLRRFEAPRRGAGVAKIDDDLFVRDYDRCILCFKCTQACGEDHQFVFAITGAGRGADASIATPFDVPLPDSGCVYCGNCIAVCPTGALVGLAEHRLRLEDWRPEDQMTERTVCGYCGVGCAVDLHSQSGVPFRADSPADNEVTLGNLCIKGRFGWTHVGSDS